MIQRTLRMENLMFKKKVKIKGDWPLASVVQIVSEFYILKIIIFKFF